MFSSSVSISQILAGGEQSGNGSKNSKDIWKGNVLGDNIYFLLLSVLVALSSSILCPRVFVQMTENICQE